MGSERRRWSNPLGIAISVGSSVLALLFAALAGLAAAGLLDPGPENGPSPTRWWVAIPSAVLFAVFAWLAFLPTWSVTAGRRGIGMKKLGRTKFVGYDLFEEIRADRETSRHGIRIITKTGKVTIFPRLIDADQLVAHVDRLAGKRR